MADAIPYVHLEGPHISSADGFRGAHPREHVRPPDLASSFAGKKPPAGW